MQGIEVYKATLFWIQAYSLHAAQDLNRMHSHKKLDVDYLLKENRKLRMELKEATQLGSMHKEAVLRLSEGAADNNEIIKTLCGILRHSREEGARQRLRDQIFNLEGQIMVLQKIVNQTYDNQRQTYLLLVDDFRLLQEESSRMQLKLQSFYEKIGEVDYLSGLVTKYKEIIAPDELALASKREQQQLLDMLNLQKEQIRRLTEEKEKLMKINVHMKEEVERKKDEVKNMTMMILNDDRNYESNTGNMILNELEHDPERTESQEEGIPSERSERLGQSMMQLRQNLSTMNVTQNLNTTLNFVKLQRQLIKEVDEDNYNDGSDSDQDFDCPELSILFPDKVQQIRTNKQQAKVPYLNMKKVRQLMMKRQEKMKKQMQAEGHHINPTTKIIQLESELQITRKELTSQMLKFRTMTDDNKRMSQHILELENRIEVLVKSNHTLSHNYRNIYKDYQLCKSITNEVERLLGRKIANQRNVLDAREQLSTFMVFGEQQNEQDRLAKIVNGIFRERVHTAQRSLSP